jgi:hypothetical protein
MTTRATLLAPAHVEALNSIDLEFDAKSKREKDVINAWKEYLDVLNNSSMNQDQWNVERSNKIIELLYKMAIVLKFDFDKTHIKNSIYLPKLHGKIEEDQTAIRENMKAILEGKKALPMWVANWPQNSEENPET